jgi:hypothetical protein
MRFGPPHNFGFVNFDLIYFTTGSCRPSSHCGPSPLSIHSTHSCAILAMLSSRAFRLTHRACPAVAASRVRVALASTWAKVQQGILSSVISADSRSPGRNPGYAANRLDSRSLSNDQRLGITEAFKADTDSRKINLGELSSSCPDRRGRCVSRRCRQGMRHKQRRCLTL